MAFESGFIRYPSTDATTASTLAITAGLKASTDPATPKELFYLDGADGFQMMIGGAGANNDTANYRIWLVHATKGVLATANSKELPTGLLYSYLGSGTATFSATSTTMGGAASATATRIADGLTFTEADSTTTPKGIGDKIRGAYLTGAVQVYNPADDTDPARIWVPYADQAYAVIIEFDPTGTSTGVFALLKRCRA